MPPSDHTQTPALESVRLMQREPPAAIGKEDHIIVTAKGSDEALSRCSHIYSKCISNTLLAANPRFQPVGSELTAPALGGLGLH